ncbi:MAG: amidohydrolase family protein [Deltaproteobacteria bacterium]|nr:amidohydrolase family protein [Deltaproteobacteria bacterium]
MAEYDLLIKNGTIVDGTRMPAYRGDIGIRKGRIVAMGNLTESATRTIDATGLVVAPGFIDIHTHYDAALSGGTKWDPYASLSGWHGVTTVAIGNCGFGFAPVKPEDRDRAMRRMERTESIPLSCMQHGMRWDWVTFPEFLDSLERGGLGVNAASLVPYSPLRAYVLGNEAARDPEYKVTEEQLQQMKNILREGLKAGGFGFSATWSMANRDYDGGYLPTHVAPREEFLEMAKVMREFNRGAIEWTMGRALQKLGHEFLIELAQTSGRPVNWNAIIYDPTHPDSWQKELDWAEKAYKQAVVLPVNICLPIEFEFTLQSIGLFDNLPAWNEATVGTLEERKAKLADPDRRPKLRADMDRARSVLPQAGEGRRGDGEAGQIQMFRWNETLIDDVHLEKNKHFKGRTIAEVANELNKHPVDTMLDLAVEEDLKTEFNMQGLINNNEEAVAAIVKHPLTLIGASDGGAHTKFLTTGRYPTHFLAHWVRDKQLMTLEEAHWRLSTMVGWAIGIRDRGWLREGMPADIVVYDFDKLTVKPMETVRDLPDGDWRRVQKADGYRFIIVNGQITFEDNVCTNALPGKMLRSYDQASAA